jgi:hypothetical protein
MVVVVFLFLGKYLVELGIKWQLTAPQINTTHEQFNVVLN